MPIFCTTHTEIEPIKYCIECGTLLCAQCYVSHNHIQIIDINRYSYVQRLISQSKCFSKLIQSLIQIKKQINSAINIIITHAETKQLQSYQMAQSNILFLNIADFKNKLEAINYTALEFLDTSVKEVYYSFFSSLHEKTALFESSIEH